MLLLLLRAVVGKGGRACRPIWPSACRCCCYRSPLYRVMPVGAQAVSTSGDSRMRACGEHMHVQKGVSIDASGTRQSTLLHIVAAEAVLTLAALLYFYQYLLHPDNDILDGHPVYDCFDALRKHFDSSSIVTAPFCAKHMTRALHHRSHTKVVLTSRGCAGVRGAGARMCDSYSTSAPACCSAVAPACYLRPLQTLPSSPDNSKTIVDIAAAVYWEYQKLLPACVAYRKHAFVPSLCERNGVGIWARHHPQSVKTPFSSTIKDDENSNRTITGLVFLWNRQASTNITNWKVRDS